MGFSGTQAVVSSSSAAMAGLMSTAEETPITATARVVATASRRPIPRLD